MKKLVCIALALVLVLAACTAYAARWQCERCGSKVDDRMEQCPDCGALRPRVTETPAPEMPTPEEPSAPPVPSPWVCLLCGMQNAGTQARCWKCEATAGSTPTVPPTVPPVNVGEYVTFGHYPQTAGGEDNTPIEWLVLAVEGRKALLISRYGLDCQPYERSIETDGVWMTRSLEKWMNAIFLDRAFTAEEQAGIHTAAGDRVFLLTYEEAGAYFADDAARMCAPTDYAVNQGAQFGDEGCGIWRLVAPGRSSLFSVNCVEMDGSLGCHLLDGWDYMVRPALWVDLDSGSF